MGHIRNLYDKDDCGYALILGAQIDFTGVHSSS